MKAVKSSGYAIKYIKDPSEAVQLEAVKRNGWAIQYIRNPSEAVQLMAVKNDYRVIMYLEKPSEAVKFAGYDKKYFKSQAEVLQLEAVKNNASAIQSIENPSESVQVAAVEKDSSCIQFIKNPSESVQLVAVKLNGSAIQFIKNPSEAVQLAAVTNCGIAIQYIENPSEDIQCLAISGLSDDELVIVIGCFSERVLYWYKYGHFPEDAKDGDKEEFVSVTGISENFSLSSKQVLLFNKILFNIRKFLLRRGLVGTARLYERSGVIYLTAGGVCYTYFNGKVSVKGIEGTNKEKETAVKFIEGTVSLLCSKVPFSIKSLKFSVSNDPLSSGSMVGSSDEPGSIDIVLK